MNEIVDFHSHILPRIDDGSASIEESLSMLRIEANQGISCVVATPHFYANVDDPHSFLVRRKGAYRNLREKMAEQPDLPEVILGAEVHFFSGISDCEELSQLTIGKSRYLLLEMPPSPWTNKMYAELEGIRVKRDIIPIIAHVDRYLGLLNTYGIPRQLEKLPVLVQANASFFLRRDSQSRAIRMLERDQIQLLGSDCHNLTSRAPNLKEALQVINRYTSSGTLKRVCRYQDQVLGDVADR